MRILSKFSQRIHFFGDDETIDYISLFKLSGATIEDWRALHDLKIADTRTALSDHTALVASIKI